MNQEIVKVDRLKWRYGKGEWIICTGISEATIVNVGMWDGKFFLIGCPWFQIRFERHWRTS